MLSKQVLLMLEYEDRILWVKYAEKEMQLILYFPFCKLIKITEGGIVVMERDGG